MLERLFQTLPTVGNTFVNGFSQRLQRVKEKSQRFSQRLQRFSKRFQRVPNGYPTASAVLRETVSVRFRVRGHIFLDSTYSAHWLPKPITTAREPLIYQHILDLFAPPGTMLSSLTAASLPDKVLAREGP